MIDTISKSTIESFRQVFLLCASILSDIFKKKEHRYRAAILADLLFLCTVFYFGFSHKTFSFPLSPFPQTTVAKKQQGEVFGFAPFWTFDKLSNVDFSTLTTFAYFGITVNSDGSLLQDDPGYQTFMSPQASAIFQKAHSYNTRVVLTLTQMDNSSILALMDNPDAQRTTINQALALVKEKKIDGINVDFEYMGDPGDAYRAKFSTFIKNLTDTFHNEIPGSNITVSVYASAIKDPKIYDVGALGRTADGIFMMAYDFAVSGSENAIPTSPLYGYKQGKYWYDVSTAVDDFLKVMPANKLILGLPWYGYNYSVTSPTVDAETGWYGGTAQMYGPVENDITPASSDITNYQTGWDNLGKVGWKAYYVPSQGTWRMIFIDDPKSLGIKYDFAKSKNLAGVGIWALGFEDGRQDVWNVLREKFGTKIADNHSIVQKAYANTD